MGVWGLRPQRVQGRALALTAGVEIFGGWYNRHVAPGGPEAATAVAGAGASGVGACASGVGIRESRRGVAVSYLKPICTGSWQGAPMRYGQKGYWAGEKLADGARAYPPYVVAFTAWAAAGLRCSRRSRGRFCAPANPLRRISPAAGTAGIWCRTDHRAAPA